uniref:Zinc finger protein 710 n=1 Tax=Gallus gallus TaxID=9031 RepID=A0A8V0Z6N3_CHICK
MLCTLSFAMTTRGTDMDRFTECGTQTDAVVVLSLAQAAVLGLVSDNELLGATVSPAGFFPGLGGEGEPDITAEPESEGMAPDGQEDESLEAECSPEKHARRRKRPPVRLLPKVKREEAEAEVFEVAVPEEDEADLQHGAPPAPPPDPTPEPSGVVKMIDLSTFSRKPRRLRHLRRHTRQQPHGREPNPAQGTAQTPCAFEAGAPSPGEPEAPASPERVKSEQGFSWQEPGEMEADAAGDNSEHSKKAQLDRLDINVQIDDSYLVEAGDRQKRWQCRMCEKSYTSKYNLVTHILGHNGIKPHSCPHCNKLFKQPSHLQTHLLTHQGTRAAQVRGVQQGVHADQPPEAAHAAAHRHQALQLPLLRPRLRLPQRAEGTRGEARERPLPRLRGVRAGLLHAHPAEAAPGHAPGPHAVPVPGVQQVLPLPQPAAEPHAEAPECPALCLHRVRHGVQPDPPPQAALAHAQGREGVQVRGVRARVHAAGQHEAAHAHPHQRPALPVPHLLQDVCAEADAEDPHDCALTGEAIQVQGLREVLQPHVQPAGPHAPARGQQALQVPLLLQQVQLERQPEPAHEGQAWRDGHQSGQSRSHDGPVWG